MSLAPEASPVRDIPSDHLSEFTRNYTTQRGGLEDRFASRHLKQQSFPAARVQIKQTNQAGGGENGRRGAFVHKIKENTSYLEARAAERHQHACERRATMSSVRVCVYGGGGTL